MKGINHLDWQQHTIQKYISTQSILFVNQFHCVYNLLHVSVLRCLRKILKSVC